MLDNWSNIFANARAKAEQMARQYGYTNVDQLTENFVKEKVRELYGELPEY